MDARSSTSSSDRLGAAYLRGLAFLVPLLAIIWAAGLACQRAFPDVNELKYQAMFEPGARQPNVIVGSSVAAYGIDPRYLERPFFNYAFNGAGPAFIRDWYQAFKAQQRPPETVIYSIEWFALKYSADHSRKLQYDAIYFPLPRLAGFLRRGEVSAPALAGRLFPLVSRHEALQNWLFRQESPLEVEYQRYDQGFVPVNSQKDQLTAYLRKYDRYPVDRGILAELQAGLAEMQHDGVRVILVHPPLYAPLVGLHPAEEALLADVAREHRMPFLDYAGSPLAYDRSLFLDDRHLNERGSQAFSRQLARDLGMRRLLPPAAR